MTNWYSIRARSTGAEISIYDEIGAYGVSAKGFLAELGALPEGTPIDLRLNSPGGSVFDAVAIHNALQRHAGSVTVWIDGIAASAASYVAMAGDEIVMPENAFLMIHDPSGLAIGTAADMRAMAEALEKVKGSLVSGYAAKSGRTPEDIAALMSAATWFDATDALEAGLATRIAAPVRIAARFDIGRFRNAPPALATAVAAGVNADAGDPREYVERTEDAEVLEDGDDGSDGDAAEALVGTDADAATGTTAEGNQDPDAEGDGAAMIDPARSPPGTPPPGDTLSDPAAIRAAAIAHARAVIDLCQLAGQPQMAGRFLEEGLGLDEVRNRLLAARVEAEPEITPHHPQPGRSPAARPWGDVIARTFKQKG